MSRRTLFRVVREDLGFSAFKRQRKQGIPPTGVPKWLLRSKDLLRRHEFGLLDFTDEKKWTIEEHYNCQNHRIYATTVEEARTNRKYYIERGQAPKYVMTWAATSENGKMELEFLPS